VTSDVELLGVGFCALWDMSSLDYVQDIFRRIRQTKRDTFTDRMARFWADQTVEHEFEPLEIGISKNKVVNDGLVRVAELVTGTVGLNSGFQQSTGFFSYNAVGSGTNPVSASDYQLQAEVARVGLADSGFQTAAGQIMRFGGFYAPSTVSCTVNESGVFDDPNSGVMLYRTVFPLGQGITHTVNVDFFSVAHSIYQYSV